MEIENAIIILGPGKSGTTLLNDILSMHEDLFWISSYLNKHPATSSLAIFNNLMKIRGLEKYSRNRNKFPRPAESFQFWNYHISNFHKNPVEFDNLEIQNAQKAIKNIAKWQPGKRLIIKLTGPTRLPFIKEIFKDPYIIWIDRNPNAIIASFLKSKWRYKDKPEIFAKKTRKELLKEYAEYYKWIDKEKNDLKRYNFKAVNYESLVNDPNRFFRKLCEFLDLNYSSRFQELVKDRRINRTANEKFKKVFSEEDIAQIQRIINT